MKHLVVALVVLAAAPASAQTSRSPHRAWLGLVGGMAIESSPENDPDGDYDDRTILLGGIDVGIQKISGNKALSIDLDAYPGSGIYRGRAAIVVGYGFASRYSEPCIGSPGYTCRNVSVDNRVRGIFGLKLGGEAGLASDPYAAIEAGLALRTQAWADLSVLYDPLSSSFGGALDLGFQIGRGYGALEFRGIGGDHALPLVITLAFGFTPRV
jgi:hypothetical protein